MNPYDDCADALDITANTEYIINTSNASADGALCSGSMENNIWLTWTCPADWVGVAFIHLFNQDCACPNGTQMSIYTAGTVCTPSGSPTCEIDLNPNNSDDFYGSFTPTPGVTYLINLDGYAGCACTFSFLISTSNVAVVLPIELIYFNGEREGDGILLQWETASELNNDFFAIERSNNGNLFRELGTIAGAGNSSYSTSYRFLDSNPAPGVNYYRLKQTDFDGEYVYAPVISINCTHDLELSIYPNPSSDSFNVRFGESSEPQGMIIIRNTIGQKVLSQEFLSHEESVNIHELPEGIYFVELSVAGKVSIIKFTKQ